MTSNPNFFHKHRKLKRPMMVTLPDGPNKMIHIVGEIKLNPSINLHQVLLVPNFKFNLLSIGKLLQTNKTLSALFNFDSWILQDHTTKIILAEVVDHLVYTSSQPLHLPTLLHYILPILLNM